MKRQTLIILLGFLLVSGCQQQEVVSPATETGEDLRSKLVQADIVSTRGKAGGLEEMVAGINEQIAAYGIQLAKVEYFGAETAGNVIFFNNVGNKQLSSDYVPNDPRNGTGTSVPYIIDATELGTSSGMTPLQTFNSINSAMSTWDDLTCSQGLDIPFLGATPFDAGYVQYLLGFGGIAGFFPGAILHAGILPASFFDAIRPGGGSGILGVTFTFVWLDDLDQNGKTDVAIKEIYYNDAFNWQDAPDDVLGNGIYDFETVVLHEVGHGLSQAHFGKAFGTPSNGKLHFSPYALMNAGYSIARREVIQTDNAGHCSIWADWPNN